MKEGWEYKKLGEIATDMYRGSGIKRDQVTKDGIPCVRYGEIYTTYNVAFDSCVSYTKEEYISSPKYFGHGDLLFAITGESVEDIGKTIAYLGHDKCLCGGDIICMKHNQNPKFLAYALSTPNAIRQKGIGKTKLKVVHTNAPALKAINIPLAPLSEQQSIVDYLDSAFAKIDAMKANAEKALNEAKALFQASLKEMLEPKEGWEEKTLGNIGELKNGMNFNKNESGYNVHILGVGDFGNLFQIGDTDSLQLISLNSNPSDEYILKNEDIVFVRSNGNKNLVGRCVLIHIGNEPCSFSGFCIRFRKKSNEVDACYLTHFLKTENARKKLVGNGANISNLNQKVLNDFIVSYPSITEQQSIVATLDSLKSKVDRLQENFDKISQECDALKQAILRQVFE